jgi:hypothetical protein
VREPYCIVELRLGQEFLPPYVAVGVRDKRAAERAAVEWARDRYGMNHEFELAEVRCVATGQVSRESTL